MANCLDYPPFESVVDGDEVGFDIDLVEEVAGRLGLTVEWIRADFDTVFTAVAGDQFDMVAAAATILLDDLGDGAQRVEYDDSGRILP